MIYSKQNNTEISFFFHIKNSIWGESAFNIHVAYFEARPLAGLAIIVWIIEGRPAHKWNKNQTGHNFDPLLTWHTKYKHVNMPQMASGRPVVSTHASQRSVSRRSAWHTILISSLSLNSLKLPVAFALFDLPAFQFSTAHFICISQPTFFRGRP